MSNPTNYNTKINGKNKKKNDSLMNSSDIIIISIGLVLIIEGLLYFTLANKLDLVISALSSMNPQKIKKISIILVFIGLCLIYFIIRPYI